jgi:hypothetical protein
MVYNAKEAVELKNKTELPVDSILTGVITHIEDGVVKKFISEEAAKEWQGDINSPAIQLTIELQIGEEVKQQIHLHQRYTYLLEEGKTLYSPKSNLGKYKKKYGKLPEPGDQVKVITNENGFGKIKLD